MWDLGEHSSGSRAKGTKEAEGSDGTGGSAAVLGGGLEWRKGVEGLEILKGCVQK